MRKKRMIIDERFRTYINSIDMPHTDFLENLYLEAVKNDVPVIRREMQSFLKTFLLIARPKNILEVGTAVGFSAILMAQYAPHPCFITTIENYEKRILEARKNIPASGHGDKIKLIEGDALEVLKTLDRPYDFIFMDAAKGQYINFLPDIKALMKPGSILISDNVLQDGDIIESRFVVERRDRTIHKRMREYLYALKHDEEFSTSIIPLGDGITISVKR